MTLQVHSLERRGPVPARRNGRADGPLGARRGGQGLGLGVKCVCCVAMRRQTLLKRCHFSVLSEGSVPQLSVISLDVTAGFLFKLMQKDWVCSGLPRAGLGAVCDRSGKTIYRSAKGNKVCDSALSTHTPTSQDGPWSRSGGSSKWPSARNPPAGRATALSSQVGLLLAVQFKVWVVRDSKPNSKCIQ